MYTAAAPPGPMNIQTVRIKIFIRFNDTEFYLEPFIQTSASGNCAAAAARTAMIPYCYTQRVEGAPGASSRTEKWKKSVGSAIPAKFAILYVYNNLFGRLVLLASASARRRRYFILLLFFFPIFSRDNCITC